MKRRSLKSLGSVILFLISIFSTLTLIKFGALWKGIMSKDRTLSINLGNGNCKWTAALPLGLGADVFGTIIASYPASGMRIAWQHTEGLTGIQVGDDFDYVPPDALERTGIVKTQYPHLEGIWSWGEKFDQVILLIRNPRKAFPSYHTLLSEIHYGSDWETVSKYYKTIFQKKPDISKWIRWRDLLFEEELVLWSQFIDYWMSGGKQYWLDLDFERNLQWPFKLVDENERVVDAHCVYEMNCHPATVISFDRLFDPVTGPDEATKIASVLEGKKGMTVIEDEAIPCVWNATMDKENTGVAPNDFDRSGIDDSDYVFTLGQLRAMKEEVIRMRNKYASDSWTGNAHAKDLVSYFNDYIIDLSNEIMLKEGMFVPTPAPNEEYKNHLYAWYVSIGRAGRYPREKMEKMEGVWDKVKHLYEE